MDNALGRPRMNMNSLLGRTMAPVFTLTHISGFAAPVTRQDDYPTLERAIKASVYFERQAASAYLTFVSFVTDADGDVVWTPCS